MATVMSKYSFDQLQDSPKKQAAIRFVGIGEYSQVERFLVPDECYPERDFINWGSLDLSDIRQLSQAVGYNYFNEDSMKWFKSRITNIEIIRGRIYFIDSTHGQMFGLKRGYKVRSLSNEVRVMCEHDGEFDSLSKAKAFLKSIRTGKVKA